MDALAAGGVDEQGKAIDIQRSAIAVIQRAVATVKKAPVVLKALLGMAGNFRQRFAAGGAVYAQEVMTVY